MAVARDRARAGVPSLVLALLLAACGGSGSGSGGPPPDGSGASCAEGAETSFASTWDGIQTVVFERHGCTAEACHGGAASGGLVLSSEVAYANVVEVPAVSSRLRLIEPGDEERSYLWRKLAAGTRPGRIEIAGSPMPNGAPPLSEDELELLRLWIYAGAPETGTVVGSEDLLDACLPPPEPIVIKPLEPPAPGTGLQFQMPEWQLAAGSEREVCFASYFDFTEQVPGEFRDASGRGFSFYAFDLRQDPQSHHLILYYPYANFAPQPPDPHHPSFGRWTCGGGPRAGEECEPLDPASCGDEGMCHSEIRESFGCIGFGPEPAPPVTVGGAQQAQSYVEFHQGVYAQIPMRGIAYWNSHAFNLTATDATMHARINYLFADDLRYFVQTIDDNSTIFLPDAPPYTTEIVCADYVLPRGARLFELNSHTHKRGKRFTIEGPDGTLLYESFVYNDPVTQRFDPPLAFDSADPAERTLHYCSLYNNGVRPDGSPDPEAVTRLSRIPSSARDVFGGAFGGTCHPVACTAGRIAAPCDGEADDAACDSSPGAGDGECDACPITGGESTENEMFLIGGSFYVDPQAAGELAR
ncbi:MAG: hypothetical protein FJ144_21920 [Deltaproteobacteria bacterium]|nr:hypothetical protein [Deltaproteobacteria bacterium]